MKHIDMFGSREPSKMKEMLIITMHFNLGQNYGNFEFSNFLQNVKNAKILLNHAKKRDFDEIFYPQVSKHSTLANS